MYASYALFLTFDGRTVTDVGALGTISLEKGEYCYIGSAMNGLEQRLRRHFSKEKKIHWHIDRLTVRADRMEAYTTGDIGECDLRRYAERCGMIPAADGFGCSDCRCGTHLLRSEKGAKDEMIRLMGMTFFGVCLPAPSF